jgi:hypothetical protein
MFLGPEKEAIPTRSGGATRGSRGAVDPAHLLQCRHQHFAHGGVSVDPSQETPCGRVGGGGAGRTSRDADAKGPLAAIEDTVRKGAQLMRRRRH